MKIKHVMFLGVFLMIACFVAGNQAITVKARDVFSTELKLTQVEDIGAYHDYTINSLSINTTITYPNCQDGNHVYKLVLNKDGYIKFKLASHNVYKTTILSGAKSSSTITAANLNATIYRDQELYNPVSTTVTAKNDSSVEMSQIALDKGVYYLSVNTDKYVNTLSNGTSTIAYTIGKADLIIYYQPVECDELYRPSMVGTENPITLGMDYRGLLTTANPRDYYTFKLTERALVRFDLMYSSANPTKFVLYGDKRQELLTKNISGNNAINKFDKFLEPGTYYCSMETTKQYDGGRTNLLISPTYYPLKLNVKSTTMNTYIQVNTIDYPLEVRWLAGEVNTADMTNPIWKSAKVITDTLTFGVNKKGFYTVRVTDQYGNIFMNTVEVKKCDEEAPDIPKIKTAKVDTFIIKGTAEKNSLITIYVNTKAYTCTADAKGAWTCTLPTKLVKAGVIEATAQDLSGNVSEKAELILE